MNVLITGGTGSLGQAIVRRLTRHGIRTADKIVVFSRDEAAHVRMADTPEFRDPRIIYHIGDVTDKDSVCRAIRTHGVDYVVHAAALKHVPVAEKQPSECIAVNVIGSQNVLKACLELEVKRVALVSTDKAAQPSNVYGISKALMERLMPEYVAMGLHVNTVRFGNLIGSRGSVLELFLRQIAATGRVTATDVSMTRFFIRVSQAADATIYALNCERPGHTLIPQMKATTLKNFIDAVFEYARRPAQIDLLGLRPGEKKHELIVGNDDLGRTVQLPEFLGIALAPGTVAKPCLSTPLSSETAPQMGSDEILGMIAEVQPAIAR